MKIDRSRISIIPMDVCDALIGLRRAGQGMFAVVTVVDGQGSETVVDRLEPHHGVGRRTRVATASPFYLQAPLPAAGPLVFVEDRALGGHAGADRIALPVRHHDVNACTITADGRFAVVNAPDQLVRVDLHARTLESRPCHEQWFGLAISPDDRTLAAATNEPGREVCLLDVETLEVVAFFDLSSFVYQPVFSPDGRMLAVTDDKGVLLVEREGGRSRRIRETGFEVMSCAFDPSGRYLATAERDLVVTEVDSGREAGRWSLDDLRAMADVTPDQVRRLRELMDDPEYTPSHDTEAGSGVSSVSWLPQGLLVTAFGGHIWGLEPAQ